MNLDALADFLCNGIEHCNRSEAIDYLMEEFNVSMTQAENLYALGLVLLCQPPQLSKNLLPRIAEALEESV